MNFQEYQARATESADYPEMKEGGLVYPALGLAGEAGEVADKIKKIWRNRGASSGEDLTPEEYRALSLELGDVLWYCAALATAMKTSLEAFAEMNLAKLADRKARGVIKSEGDNR